jgi:hypothetical protein
MKLNKEEVQKRVEEVTTHWNEDYMDYQEEALRIAIFELTLEKLGYNIPNLLWKDNQLLWEDNQ